jgi:hypothetical protein
VKRLSPLAAALLVAACGSSGGGSDASAKRGYINQADAICARTNSNMSETNARLDELARSARQVSEYQDDLADGQFEARDELDSLKKLPVPEGDEAKIKKIVTARDHQLDLIDLLIAASRHNDASKFKALSTAVDGARKTVQGLTSEYGFKICGQDAATAGK